MKAVTFTGLLIVFFFYMLSCKTVQPEGETMRTPPLLNFITDLDVTCINTNIKEQHVSIYRKNKNEFLLESTRTNYFNDNGTLQRIIEKKNKELLRRDHEYAEKGNFINVIFLTNDKEDLRHHYIYKKA